MNAALRNGSAALSFDGVVHQRERDRVMNVWIHSAVLATTLAAAIAVGMASAATPGNDASFAAAKADRLPVVAETDAYVTVETRGNGVSVLKRVPLN